jgi:hypothetical protein
MILLEVSNYCILKNYRLVERENYSFLHSLLTRCTYKNPKFVKNEKYGYSNYGVEEYLYTYFYKDDDIYFFRGVTKVILNSCNNFGIKYSVVKKFNYGNKIDSSSYLKNVELREDQFEFFDKVLKHKQGILRCPTSFGKTISSLYTALNLGVVTTIVVHTTFLQKQWINELVNIFKYDKKLIGGCGGSFNKPRLGDINICLYQTLNKPDVLKIFNKVTGFLIAEECQKVSVNQFSFVVNNFYSYFKIGISASEKRKDGLEFITLDSLGEVIFKPVEKQSTSKILSKIQVIHSKYFDYEYGWDKSNVELVNRLSLDVERNKLILNRALLYIKRNKQVMIIVERKEQAFLLASILKDKGFKVGCLVGNVSKDDLEQFKYNKSKLLAKDYDDKKAYDFIKLNAENKKLQCIIGTQKAEVGLSIRTLNHLIISSLATSNISDRLNQIVGRVERTHGELEELYGVKDTPTVDIIFDSKMKHIKKNLAELKRFYTNRIIEIY